MDTLTPQQSAAAHAIKQLRQRLLDLTNRNRLLNFRHTTNSRTHIRVIDELPDHICTVLVEGERLFFQSLPEPPEEPEDEKSDAFLTALEQARATDEAYVNALLELESEGEGADPDRAQRLERGLKDRVREHLGLPHWRHPASMSLADYARSLGWSPGYELPEPGAGTPAVEEHTDNQIRVLHLPAEMQRKLSGIYSNASTALKETGVNTLYVAFGFLEWRAPPPGPASPMLAPLLLLPVEIDRQLLDGLYRYGITWTGDEPEVNLTLSERLTQDCGLRLPDLDEDETPERYFAKVADRIRTQPGWRVRRFVTIGHFAFARLVMYQDLDETRWGDGGLAKRELLARLLGGAEESDGVIYAPEYDVDEPSIAAEVPVLVADADSSQFSAIVDVMRGRDLALKGPPGTGKSQTITNTIAAALARGKRVLFVAEKMAALEVVKKRLDDAGLGDFCLELHSTKARKRDVLDSLQARIEITDSLPEPPTLDEALREIEQLKRRLTGYVRLINQPFGRLGKTIQEILWSEQNTRARAAALPDGLDNLLRADAEAVAPFAADEARRLFDNAETLDRVFRARYGSIEAHPWYGVRSGELSIFGQEEVVRTFGRCREAASALREEMEALARSLDAELCRSIGDVSALTGMLESLPAVSEETIDGTLISRLLAAEPRAQLAALLALIDDHHRAVTALSRRVDDVEAALGRADEIAALAEQACALGCADARVAELPAKIEALAGAAEALARAAGLGHRLRRLFGLSGPLTVHVVERLAQAAAFVAATPEPILQQRRPALVHPDGREAVRLAMEKASALKEQRRVLDSEMTIPGDAAPQALRRHRDAVTAAGLFSFLRGSYRAARRAHRALRPGSRAKAPEMARDFERVAAHLEAVRGVEASVALRELCGPRFAGLDTDFAALLDVVGFAEQVRRRFAGLDETSRAVRTALLDGDAGLITELAEIARLGDFEALRATLAALPASVDTDLDAEVQPSERQVTRLRTLETAARDLRLKADLAVGEGNMLAEGLRAIPVLRERIDGTDSPVSCSGAPSRAR